MEKLRVLSLFAGIGGFDLGLERTGGFESVVFCEIEPFCQRVLAKHWPGVPCYPDARSLTGEQVGPIDVICGGFPCQDLSFAGRGAGLDGERSGLWREYARLVGEIRPRFVVVENVSALLVRGFGRVAGDLAALGYDLWWDCIPASAVGAPHRRDRLWIVAYARGEQHQGFGDALRRAVAQELSRHTYHGGEPTSAVNDEASGLPRLVAHASRDEPGRSVERLKRQRTRKGGQSIALGNAHGQRLPSAGLAGAVGQSDGGVKSRSAPDGASWWLTEPDVGRVAHGVPARVDRLRSLGNAVVPQIPELIGRAILAAIPTPTTTKAEAA